MDGNKAPINYQSPQIKHATCITDSFTDGCVNHDMFHDMFYDTLVYQQTNKQTSKPTNKPGRRISVEGKIKPPLSNGETRKPEISGVVWECTAAKRGTGQPPSASDGAKKGGLEIGKRATSRRARGREEAGGGRRGRAGVSLRRRFPR